MKVNSLRGRCLKGKGKGVLGKGVLGVWSRALILFSFPFERPPRRLEGQWGNECIKSRTLMPLQTSSNFSRPWQMSQSACFSSRILCVVIFWQETACASKAPGWPRGLQMPAPSPPGLTGRENAPQKPLVHGGRGGGRSWNSLMLNIWFLPLRLVVINLTILISVNDQNHSSCVRQRFIFHTQKNPNFRICLPKKSLLFLAYPKKSLSVFASANVIIHLLES